MAELSRPTIVRLQISNEQGEELRVVVDPQHVVRHLVHNPTAPTPEGEALGFDQEGAKRVRDLVAHVRVAHVQTGQDDALDFKGRRDVFRHHFTTEHVNEYDTGRHYEVDVLPALHQQRPIDALKPRDDVTGVQTWHQFASATDELTQAAKQFRRRSLNDDFSGPARTCIFSLRCVLPLPFPASQLSVFAGRHVRLRQGRLDSQVPVLFLQGLHFGFLGVDRGLLIHSFRVHHALAEATGGRLGVDDIHRLRLLQPVLTCRKAAGVFREVSISVLVQCPIWAGQGRVYLRKQHLRVNSVCDQLGKLSSHMPCFPHGWEKLFRMENVAYEVCTGLLCILPIAFQRRMTQKLSCFQTNDKHRL